MQIFVVLAVGACVLGSILGSFLNALLFRFNTGGGFFKEMSGRSHCMRCGHTLSSFDLVPVVSYIFLRGRCRYCEAGVSLQYPVVEILAAALSLGVFLRTFPSDSTLWSAISAGQYVFFLFVWLIILFIVVYDLRHMIIPWSASLLLLFLALVSLALFQPPIVWSLLSGPLLALPLFLLSLVSGGKWMGWADSLFELSLGWLLGLTMGMTALMLAIWSGAAVGIVLVATTKRGTIHMKSEIPFAPFLALGAAVTFFLHVDFFSSLPLLF
jgi:leader peptidase (prepilin peptidase)/N-methyltransferase